MAPDPSLLDALREIAGGVDVLDDPGLTERYRCDWTGRFAAEAAVVARPHDADQVAAIVSLCAERGFPIVPQGGNTGLVGGSIPLAGEVVVSTEHLGGIESVDATTGQLVAGAGTTLADVQRAATDHGWAYGVDIGSRDSATIGGTVATNAGGLHVLRYGATRAQVLGVAFVTGTGQILGLPAGTLRNNTGYHLPGLLTGSEGTLGVITSVRLKLVPALACRTTALLRFADPGDAARSVEALRGVLPSVESAEFFLGAGLELVCRAFGFPTPFDKTAGGYVLAEVADGEDRTEALGEAVAALGGVSDVAVAQDTAGRARLWRYRERHTEAIATVGTPHKLDVAVPPGTLADFTNRIPRVVADIAPDATCWLFGHGGEASMHVNVTGLDDDDDTVDEAVLKLVTDMGGSISAEHGIGTAKVRWMGLAHNPVELDLLRRIKDAFDPRGIMNPAVQVPPG